MELLENTTRVTLVKHIQVFANHEATTFEVTREYDLSIDDGDERVDNVAIDIELATTTDLSTCKVDAIIDLIHIFFNDDPTSNQHLFNCVGHKNHDLTLVPTDKIPSFNTFIFDDYSSEFIAKYQFKNTLSINALNNIIGTDFDIEETDTDEHGNVTAIMKYTDSEEPKLMYGLINRIICKLNIILLK